MISSKLIIFYQKHRLTNEPLSNPGPDNWFCFNDPAKVSKRLLLKNFNLDLKS